MDLVLLGYFGPEVMMPIASVLAGIGGAVLMFGRSTLMRTRRWMQSVQAIWKKG